MASSSKNTACGQGLSLNQRVSVDNALTKIKLHERLQDVAYWGKIIGKERDYIIAQAVKYSTKVEKLRYFSQDNGVTFAKLPDLDSFILEKAPLHHVRFTGNPSLKLKDPRPAGTQEEEEEEFEHEEEEEDAEVAPERRLTEMERLAYVVDQIDSHCCVTPKGSLYMDAFGNIHVNNNFAGLPLAEASDLSNYLLIRTPQQERTLAQIHRAGTVNNTAFLDSLALDTPTGKWALLVNKSGTEVTLRSLLWPGFEFRMDVGSRQWTRSYVGLGEDNRDLAFMI